MGGHLGEQGQQARQLAWGRDPKHRCCLKEMQPQRHASVQGCQNEAQQQHHFCLQSCVTLRRRVHSRLPLLGVWGMLEKGMGLGLDCARQDKQRTGLQMQVQMHSQQFLCHVLRKGMGTKRPVGQEVCIKHQRMQRPKGLHHPARWQAAAAR